MPKSWSSCRAVVRMSREGVSGGEVRHTLVGGGVEDQCLGNLGVESSRSLMGFAHPLLFSLILLIIY